MKLKINPDDKTIRHHGVFEVDLPGEAYFTKPLGEKLCIIDMDSRLFDEPGQIFNEDGMNWDDAETVHGLSTGFLNHYLYGR